MYSPFPPRSDEASSFGPSDRLTPPADSLGRGDELLLLILACQTFVEDLDFIICHDNPRVNRVSAVRMPVFPLLPDRLPSTGRGPAAHRPTTIPNCKNPSRPCGRHAQPRRRDP